MDSITLENFRCFGAVLQTARLAPLTLLVGENSTGKTSFLALIRALWDVAIREEAPDFREQPYDLGSFREVAHEHGGNPAQSFEARFVDGPSSYSVVFKEHNTFPYPVKRWFGAGDGSWVEISNPIQAEGSMKIHIDSGERVFALKARPIRDETDLASIDFFLSAVGWRNRERDHARTLVELVEGEEFESQDYEIIGNLTRAIRNVRFPQSDIGRPFAGAPVRSKPRRTYDPTRLARDPEGAYTPSYLADLSRSNPLAWNTLKNRLEQFGGNAGLFNEISILNPFGGTGGSPFQVQVRKYDKRRKGPWRNIVDVGYGVSQALPIIVDLFREDMPPISLLQQPEVHLHPSAQAALGSLFSSIAGERIAPNARGLGRHSKRQLIVETHSDYIIDRVRMDVRDKKTSLKPEDVSILYFERVGSDVTIHSLRIDEQGNVLGAPPSYGQFFLDETNRSIGI